MLPDPHPCRHVQACSPQTHSCVSIIAILEGLVISTCWAQRHTEARQCYACLTELTTPCACLSRLLSSSLNSDRSLLVAGALSPCDARHACAALISSTTASTAQDASYIRLNAVASTLQTRVRLRDLLAVASRGRIARVWLS